MQVQLSLVLGFLKRKNDTDLARADIFHVQKGLIKSLKISVAEFRPIFQGLGHFAYVYHRPQ